ncbi:hypothetical protein HH303_08415 [Rhodospirillaceae bacterium KN72]|uniref:Uncharacterized protein n=1 Tax=Pacificispira spongiicola TaxID=2729598 RepID=A0A7Y0DZL3_9PROT|nr:hypothetical protein [Pacificispira spongiicola]NMM44500.1 hypothetical protein [Pacificispira spongiicola]
METTMTKERFLEILDAYGADSRRWPESERIDALRFAASGDAMIMEAVAEAQSLDAMLDGAAVPTLSPQAMARLRAHAHPSPLAPLSAAIHKLLQWQGPIWQPAGALAASLILGLTLGLASPDYASSLAALGETNTEAADSAASGTTTQGFDLFLDTENTL